MYTKRGSIVIWSVKSNRAVFSPVGSLSNEEIRSLRVGGQNMRMSCIMRKPDF